MKAKLWLIAFASVVCGANLAAQARTQADTAKNLSPCGTQFCTDIGQCNALCPSCVGVCV